MRIFNTNLKNFNYVNIQQLILKFSNLSSALLDFVPFMLVIGQLNLMLRTMPLLLDSSHQLLVNP